MTAAATSPGATPGAPVLEETLVGLIDTLESPKYQQSSPAFQPLNRADVAVIVGVYVLIPVILAIVALV